MRYIKCASDRVNFYENTIFPLEFSFLHKQGNIFVVLYIHKTMVSKLQYCNPLTSIIIV